MYSRLVTFAFLSVGLSACGVFSKSSRKADGGGGGGSAGETSQLVGQVKIEKGVAAEFAVGAGELKGTVVSIPGGALPDGATVALDLITGGSSEAQTNEVKFVPSYRIRMQDKTGRAITAYAPVAVKIPYNTADIAQKFRAMATQGFGLLEPSGPAQLQLTSRYKTPLVNCGTQPTASNSAPTELMQSLANSQPEITGNLKVDPSRNVELSSTQTILIQDIASLLKEIDGASPAALNGLASLFLVQTCTKEADREKAQMERSATQAEATKVANLKPVSPELALLRDCSNHEKYDADASLRQRCESSKVDKTARECVKVTDRRAFFKPIDDFFTIQTWDRYGLRKCLETHMQSFWPEHYNNLRGYACLRDNKSEMTGHREWCDSSASMVKLVDGETGASRDYIQVSSLEELAHILPSENTLPLACQETVKIMQPDENELARRVEASKAAVFSVNSITAGEGTLAVDWSPSLGAVRYRITAAFGENKREIVSAVQAAGPVTLGNLPVGNYFVRVTSYDANGIELSEATGEGSVAISPHQSRGLLSQLTVSAGTLTPSYSTSVNLYDLTVPSETSTLTLEAKAEWGRLTLDQGTPQSGNLSANLSLNYGQNTFTLKAEDAFEAERIITLRIHRQEAEVSLSGISPSRGTLTPAFSPSTFDYTLSYAGEDLNLTVLGIPANGAAALDGQALSSGEAHSLTFAAGESRNLEIKVQGADASLAKTYKIAVTRSSDAIAPVISGSTALTGAAYTRANPFTMSATLSWSAATDAGSSVRYRTVRAFNKNLVDTAAKIKACAAPHCEVLKDWSEDTEVSLSSLSAGSEHWIAVIARDDNGNATLYDIHSYAPRGVAAALDNSETFVVASKSTTAAEILVRRSISGGSFTNFGPAISGHDHDEVDLYLGSSGEWLVTGQKVSPCQGWVSQSQVYRYSDTPSASWNVLGDQVAGSNAHCSSGGTPYSASYDPVLGDLGAGKVSMIHRGSNGSWTSYAWQITPGDTTPAWGSSCTMTPAKFLGTPFSVGQITTGTLGVSFDSEPSRGTVFYTYNDAGTCSVDSSFPSLSDTGERAMPRSGARMATDGSTLYYAYIDRTDNNKAKVIAKTGGTWSALGSAASSSGAHNLSLQMLYGQLYILYKNDAGDAELKKWSGSGSAWTSVATNIFGGEVIAPRMNVGVGGTIAVGGILKSDVSKAEIKSITP